MVTYGNGQIPLSVLVPVQPGLYLTPVAAASWLRVVARVGAEHGWLPQLTDAYRALDGYWGQVETFLRRYQRSYVEYAPGRVDRRVWNGVPYWRKPGTAATAVPGTSNHGWATAVDVTGLGGFGSPKFNQFAAVATRNGWSIAEGRSVDEPWHWTKNSASFVNNPGQAVTGNIPSAPAPVRIDPVAPLPLPPLEDDMMLVRYGGVTYAVSALSIQPANEHAVSVISTHNGRAPIDLTAAGWTGLQQQIQAAIKDTAANLKGAGLGS